MSAFTFQSAVRSNVGLVRKNNQDSGYAGPNFLLVADGMGGHAGGDVASAITVGRLSDLDREEHSTEALEHLRLAILDANSRITNAVAEKPELAGMGTTVTAVLHSEDRLALAHIGDSRAYLLRDGTLTQLTADHTFVQMLVDEGRITAEEAETHPQRSVVMRVLGDVGATPELDLSIREARVGDRWLLCSDGLTGFAPLDGIEKTLRTVKDPGECAEALIGLALKGGGADNITVVIGDVVDPAEKAVVSEGESAGSIAVNPQYALLGHADTPTVRIDEIVTGAPPAPGTDTPTQATGAPHIEHDTQPLTAAAATHDAAANATATASADPLVASPASASADTDGLRPGSEEDFGDSEFSDDELFDDGPRRGWVRWVITLAVVLALAAALFMGWRFIQSQYYVTQEGGNVVVYQGISQNLGPISLSTLAEETDIAVASLPSYTQNRLDSTIPAPSREAADQIVQTLREEAAQNNQDSVNGEATDVQTQDPAPTANTADSQSPATENEQ